ncbi:hypothetical protein AAFN46_03745 [Pseudomonas sp. CAU 1711]|uniref:hypothetical protein n=1 Tax=Pseudomonas sp. CAU 1711 TaxID=3140356 RepID=UPI00325FE593
MRHLAIALLVTLLSAPALAMHCPREMARIDAMLASEPPADPEVLAEVQRLRAEGEELHKAGNHSEALKILDEALNLLQASE